MLGGRTGRGRMLWSRSYLDQVFTRDVDQLVGRRDPGRLRRFFEAYALNTAVVPLPTVHGAAEIDHKTAEAYEGLLRDLFVIETVPAWSTDRLKRLCAHPSVSLWIPDSSRVRAGPSPDRRHRGQGDRGAAGGLGQAPDLAA